jgi:hypothetical protein
MAHSLPTTTLFRTILIDPPWNEAGGGKIKRGADQHYPLLKTREIVPHDHGLRLVLPRRDRAPVPLGNQQLPGRRDAGHRRV